jgi:hypothetical protein
MAEYQIPEPEPKELDERVSIELRHLAENAVLRGEPQGEDTAAISYCWHPKLRILVGSEWWCQWWDAVPDV